MFDSRRRRRVLYNDDSDQQYLRMSGAPKTKYVQQQPAFKYVVPNAQAFIDARTTPVFDTHVDTYVWCLGNGSDPAWGGTRPFAAGMKSNQQATDLIVEACHARGLEVWGSLRMNDIHDASRATSLEAADDPMKARHPDWLLRPPGSKELPESFSEHYQWTAFNFERPEVREYRLAFIEKSASQHDFDGYELDFTRFAWYLPLGTERQKAHIMTGLVRQVRSRLNAIGRSRGRPITLAVHVFDSPGSALNLGLDVENWVDDGLVDVLVVGTGYRHYSLTSWRVVGPGGAVFGSGLSIGKHEHVSGLGADARQSDPHGRAEGRCLPLLARGRRRDLSVQSLFPGRFPGARIGRLP